MAAIFALLVSFRLLNALSIKTFFQPDEYFQSLEPAWQLAFGEESGAWITWEWKYQLRSSIHPTIFAVIYYLTAQAASILSLSPHMRAELLLASPKAAQAVCAATCDYYTWKLAQRIYGNHKISWVTLGLTIFSPWQWFCSVRTLSNCLETTLTAMALYYWPWATIGLQRIPKTLPKSVDDTSSLRYSLLLAALACTLRPTNVLIWLSLVVPFLLTSRHGKIEVIKESILCGTFVVGVSGVVDRLFYGVWTFPPLRFLWFNIMQSLAIFYGTNDWHYYLSQGLPLLLTTALPFAVMGVWNSLRLRSASPAFPARLSMAAMLIFVVFALSCISHKEVRFIYPLLPVLHVLAAKSISDTLFHQNLPSAKSSPPYLWLFVLLGIANVSLAVYSSFIHQSGVVGLTDHLRHTYERTFLQSPHPVDMTVGFLMPCHSTPWRSHLVYPSITAWALGCEPPVHLNSTERLNYIDEADRFYSSPETFLQTEIARGKGWPEYLIFFQEKESLLQGILKDSYKEDWRVFNSHVHDDWRRRGDVIVWQRTGVP